MNTEQERATFEAWAISRWPGVNLSPVQNNCGIVVPERYKHPKLQAAWEAYQAGRSALQSQDRRGAFCVWHNDPETDSSWDTGCRQLFELNDGTPSENRMSFCCYCGKPIQEVIDHARRIEGES